MNPNEKELLEKTYELSKENNHILKGIRRASRWSTIYRIFYWLLIIGVSVGSYIYIQPYIDSILTAYKNIQGELSNVKSVVDKVSNTIK
ncbi:MAG: hypothetical protein ABIF22_01060 [bacterium]